MLLAEAMGKDIAPEITNRTRAGDIRHCLPDITKAETVLGYAPRADFRLGLAGLAEWVADQTAFDRVEQARNELELRGDRKSTRLNSSHYCASRMPSSA